MSGTLRRTMMLAVGGALVAAAALYGSSSAAHARKNSDVSKVRLVLVETGEANDGGWNTNFLHGMQYFKRALPSVESKLIANVNPGSQGRQTLQTLAAQGWTAIVTNGNFGPDVAAIAPRFPEL